MRYLLEARPQSKNPQVFLRERAPKGPLASGAVMRVVAKSLRQAGIVAPKNGAHMLRQSLATQMINTGSTLKEIADILGHRDIQSTVRYAKVDVVRLAEVAMPFGFCKVMTCLHEQLHRCVALRRELGAQFDTQEGILLRFAIHSSSLEGVRSRRRLRPRLRITRRAVDTSALRHPSAVLRFLAHLKSGRSPARSRARPGPWASAASVHLG